MSIRPVRDDEREELAPFIRTGWGSTTITSRGIGTALLEATSEQARKLNSRRLWLVTTSDNLDALRFYQRREMRLARLWSDATTEARETLKPEIPLIGDHGIPLRDELELELILRTTGDSAEDPSEHRGDT